MKRYLPIILFPYTIIIALASLFSNFIMETVFKNNIFLVLLVLLLFYIIALISAIIVSIKNLVLKRSAQELLRMNMIIKLIHIPAYLLIFFAGMIFFLTIFTFAISILLMILTGMSIILSGLIGLSSIIRGLREHKLTKKKAIIHSILQFIFCADIISSIIIYRSVKTRKQNNVTHSYTI